MKGLVLLSWALSTTLLWASPSAAEPSPRGPKTAKIYFNEHLFVNDDVMLRGSHSEARVTFTRPANWKILPGSKLHVFYSHSGVLLPEHSSLTVRVADSARSVRLDRVAPEDGIKELIVPIDPSHLGPYNPINFVGGLHYTLECEDPFHPTLWASISKNSYIEFVYEEEPAFTDLAVFPFPYFDPLAYPPVDLTYVIPQNPSADTLSALARVAGAIAQDAAYRPLTIKFADRVVDKPSGNYIFVGTPEEQPGIGRLLQDAEVAMTEGGDGLLASVRIRQDGRFAALVVSGSSGEGVLKAASALVDRTTRSTLVGNVSVVQHYADSGQAELRDWEGFVPDRTNFTLQDLGFDGQTVRGVFSAPIRVDVKLQPDARPVEFRQRLNVHYAYSALIKSEISTMEVVLNGTSLHSVALDNIEGSESEWLSLEVPWHIYGPFNRLEILFHMQPDTYRECERVNDRQLWGTVFPDSNFVMPRDYWTEFPDLAAVARWGYPFSLRTDLSDTAFVMPGADAGAIKTMVRMMNFLMKPHPRQTIRVDVHYADEVSKTTLADKHLIFISPNASATASGLIAESSMSFSPDGHIGLRGEREAGLSSMAYDEGAIVEATMSPWHPQRAVLLVHESRPGVLAHLYGQDAPEVLGKLRGAVAIVSEGGEVNTVPPAATSVLGHIPMTRRLRYMLAHYWSVFLVVGVLAILLLFFAARVVLRRRREQFSDR